MREQILVRGNNSPILRLNRSQWDSTFSRVERVFCTKCVDEESSD